MSTVPTDRDLIALAAAALRPVETVPGRWVADVGAAVEAADGQVFTGACVGGYLGFCAEQAAVGQLVSRTDPVIRRVVAVWRDPADGQLHVLPPCGRCREFLHGMGPGNLDARVILGEDAAVPLRDLLPLPFWSAHPVEG